MTLDWRVILHISAAATQTDDEANNDDATEGPEPEPLCEIVLELDECRAIMQAPNAFTERSRFGINTRKLMSYLQVRLRCVMRFPCCVAVVALL